MRYKMNIRNIKIGLLAIMMAGTMLSASSGFTVDYNLLESAPGGTAKATEKAPEFPTYVVGLYKFALGMVVISALLMIVIGGFAYIASAGNQAQATTAKKIITDAILGLIVVMVAVLILNVINPDLLNAKIDSLSGLQATIVQSGSTVNKKNITHSSTNCRNIGGNNKCFDTKQECEQSAGPSAIASSCKEMQNVINNSKYYYTDTNGNYKEMSKSDCEAAATSGGTCLSGTAFKGTNFTSTQTVEEKKETLAEHEVVVADGVDISKTAKKTVMAVVNVGEPRCGGECEKKVIGTEGSNVVILADDSGTFIDSKLLNSIQAEAYKVGTTKSVEIPGGDLLTKVVRKTTTYTYPEGHALAGNTYQVVQTGIQSRGPVGWIPGSFAATSSRIRVYGEKDTPPPAAAPAA